MQLLSSLTQNVSVNEKTCYKTILVQFYCLWFA